MAVDSSAIIVLAFVATAAVFGYLAFTIISEIHTPEEQGLLFSGSLIYAKDGRVWKVVLPVATLDSRVDFRAAAVTLVFNLPGRDRIVADGVGGLVIYNSTVITGDLVERFASFKMEVMYSEYGSPTASLPVSVFAYMGPDKAFRLVVDDDDDGVLDNTYLVEFTESSNNNLVSGINLSSDIVLKVNKGSVLDMNYLVVAYAASTSYDPQIEVMSGDIIYRISLVEMLRGLTKATVFTVIAGGNSDYYLKSGETGYVIVLLPEDAEIELVPGSIDAYIVVDSDRYDLKLMLPSKISDNGVFSGVVKVVT